MAEAEIVGDGAEKRAQPGVPGPRKRWRVMVVGRSAASVVREPSSDQLGIVPDSRHQASGKRHLRRAGTD
jgi:hypothetical protein